MNNLSYWIYPLYRSGMGQITLVFSSPRFGYGETRIPVRFKTSISLNRESLPTTGDFRRCCHLPGLQSSPASPSPRYRIDNDRRRDG